MTGITNGIQSSNNRYGFQYNKYSLTWRCECQHYIQTERKSEKYKIRFLLLELYGTNNNHILAQHTWTIRIQVTKFCSDPTGKLHQSQNTVHQFRYSLPLLMYILTTKRTNTPKKKSQKSFWKFLKTRWYDFIVSAGGISWIRRSKTAKKSVLSQRRTTAFWLPLQRNKRHLLQSADRGRAQIT